MDDFIRSTTLLLVLLNPFLLVVYLVDMLRRLTWRQFSRVLLRAGTIAAAVFCLFAVLGDVIFSDVLQARFASFQIFGGVVFLLIGLQFVFQGPDALGFLRGEPGQLAGAVAMPILIGPGTISGSIVAGQQLPPLAACASVVIAVSTSVLVLLVLKALHDRVRANGEQLIERYVEVAGRILALYAGTVAVEMIMQGTQSWAERF